MARVYFFSMYSLFTLVFLNEFLEINKDVFTLLSVLAMALFLVSALYLTRGFQLYVSIISLVVGHIVLFRYDLGFDIWYSSLMEGLGMPVLFVAIPLISFPIKYGNYLESIENFVIDKSKNPGLLFSFLAVMHFVLTVPLNIGSIPTMQKLLEKVEFPKKYLALLYSAGYSSYMVFSPYDGLVNMVLLFSAITFSDYFFNGLAMVILIITVATIFLRLDKNLLDELNSSLIAPETENISHKKVYELLVHIFALIFLAVVGVKFIPLSNTLYTIAIVIICYSFIWGFLLKVLDRFKRELKEYSINLLNFKGFLPFLISASFLGSLVSYTPLKEGIEAILLALNNLPMYLIIQIFILLTMLLSVVGIHMMITVTTFAMTITPELIGLSNPAFALTLLTCWFMAMLVSPFVPYNLVVAETIDEKPLNIAFKYNLKFCLVMLIIAPMLIVTLNYLN